MRLSVLVCLLVAGSVALPARAEQLYRCVGPGAAISYQSLPCAPTARLDRVVDYRPDPVATAPQATARPRTVRNRAARTAHAPRERRVTPTAADRCRIARAQRDAALQRVGLKRTYAQLSRLDASVRAACD